MGFGLTMDRSWTCTHQDYEYEYIDFKPFCAQMVSGVFEQRCGERSLY
jgi:hypothetical protein